MPTDLVTTKLHPPESRAGVVQRPAWRSFWRGASSKLTLVSAPPGFGKSTLVADWIAERGSSEPAAWLSLATVD